MTYGQATSELDIKEIAEKVNLEIEGVDIGNGIKGRNCMSLRRTLIYQYDVPDSWYPSENIKQEIISNLKVVGSAKLFFEQNINVNINYYKGNLLVNRVSIKSREFSTFNFNLGEYFSLKDHPKMKDVNLKIKAPVGWEITEGNRPNIVKKFMHGTNTYMISIKDNITFFSRKEAIEILSDEEYVVGIISELISSFEEPILIDHKIVIIDTYPALEFVFSGKRKRLDYNFEMFTKNWMIYYEDKLVFVQGAGGNEFDFNALEQLYELITSSIIFPDQYN